MYSLTFASCQKNLLLQIVTARCAHTLYQHAHLNPFFDHFFSVKQIFEFKKASTFFFHKRCIQIYCQLCGQLNNSHFTNQNTLIFSKQAISFFHFLFFSLQMFPENISNHHNPSCRHCHYYIKNLELEQISPYPSTNHHHHQQQQLDKQRVRCRGCYPIKEQKPTLSNMYSPKYQSKYM